MNENLNISRIEDWLYQQLKGKVSANVFPGTFPSTLEEGWKDMVVIDVASVRDMSECGRNFGEAAVNVFLYVKPNSAGRKNVKRFNEMENAFAEFIQSTSNGDYFAIEVYSDADYDKTIDYHFKVISISVIIK